ncbi:PEP-CTERM protein-sorting domain-containing protein [Limimaricola pyoseonensis]|uniref:PEP-CTERM protein-sorting domain-containing protein n=2 Tax=Limimaricola pyoseonensis TaxID=521013 RepID=A0A1G7CIH3_9RHOB|nr:PEP-CTERM protein-sorting domain-containing protein [Limimaricola pyoseonensis]
MVRLLLSSLALLGMGTVAQAAPVNGTGNVTPDVIFGSGNANGAFTGTSALSRVELGLRGKLRYDTSGAPQNTFNYDGDRTYSFAVAEANAPATRSAFNFEWSINTQPFPVIDGNTGGGVGPTSVSMTEPSDLPPATEDPFLTLDKLTYQLRIDFDPTEGTDFVAFDPINQPMADHAIGTNATANGGGMVAANATQYAMLIAQNNVAQNSWNLGFFEPPGFDPQTQGKYTIELDAYISSDNIEALGLAGILDIDAGATDLPVLLASTSIDIVYGDVPAPIPLPASLPLMLGALGLGGLITRRRRS